MINLSPIMIVAIVIAAVINIAFVFKCFSKRKKSRNGDDVKQKIIKFSKQVVTTIFILLILYVVSVLIMFAKTQTEPTVLTENLFGFFKAEGGFLAIIKVAGEVTERVLAAKRKCSETPSDNREEINDYD